MEYLSYSCQKFENLEQVNLNENAYIEKFDGPSDNCLLISRKWNPAKYFLAKIATLSTNKVTSAVHTSIFLFFSSLAPLPKSVDGQQTVAVSYSS